MSIDVQTKPNVDLQPEVLEDHPDPHRIRFVRNAAGLTQTEAAELVYVSMRSWQNWEGGYRRMPLAIWELFLAKLDPALRMQIVQSRREKEWMAEHDHESLAQCLSVKRRR